MNLKNFETKEEKNKRIKEHIFDVALSMMKQIGYDNITIRMICKEADISTGMFYKHFNSKEKILAFYYDKAQEDFETIINEQLSQLSIKDQLIQFYVWICKFTADLGVDFCRNFFQSKNELMNTNLFNNKLIEITNRCIEDAIKNGFKLSKGRTPESVSKDLCIMVKGIIFDWSAHGGCYDMSDFCKQLLTRCMDGLL